MATPDINAVSASIRTEFPKFELLHKRDSRLMKLLGWLLRVVTFGQMTAFMDSFITTMGTTVYVPDQWDSWTLAAQCAVLRHERIHMRQAKRLTRPVFSLLYLLLWLPLGLAWFRAKFEMEAYAETMRAMAEYGTDIAALSYKQRMVSRFTSAQYGWMWPFRSSVERWFDATVFAVTGKA